MAHSDQKLSHTPNSIEALVVWFKIGILSFGGPAGQIALMYRILVEEKRWLDEERFLHALNYCMLLPGPEAQQLATYIGWLLHKTKGGLVAGLLFILPGALVIFALSWVYVAFSDMLLVEAAFLGIKAAVLVVVIDAVIKIGKRAITSGYMLAIAIASFLAIFFFSIPFPYIIICAGIFGIVVGHLRLGNSHNKPSETKINDDVVTVIDRMELAGELSHTQPSFSRSVKVFTILSSLWLLPIFLIWLMFGAENIFFQQSIFFSKLAVVTFGGAYAVLAYMAQQAVEVFNWLTPNEMLDGLGLAETTPGPLILVTQFVGFIGAYRSEAALSPITLGLLGSLVTLWVTFAPCFLWIFLGAPYIERLRANTRIAAALSGITSAVVGVVLNLAIWFGMHVTFKQLNEVSLLNFSLKLPAISSIDLFSLGLTVLAGILILWFRLGTIYTLIGCAGASILMTAFF